MSDALYLQNKRETNSQRLRGWAENYLRMKESEQLEAAPGPAGELLGQKLKPEEEKGAWGEIKKSFGDIATGYRQWASTFYNTIANIPGVINSAAKKLSEATGMEQKGILGEIPTQIELGLRTIAQSVTPTAEELQDRDSFLSALYRSIGQAPGTIAEYATGAKALGGPIAAFAIIDALKEADKGAVDAALGGMRGLAMGTGLKAIHGIGMGRIGSAGATGGLFGGTAAIEGAGPQEALVSGLTGAGLGAMGPGKPKGLTKEEIAAARQFKPESTGDLFAAEKKAEAANIGEMRPEFLTWAADTLAPGQTVKLKRTEGLEPGAIATIKDIQYVDTPQGKKPQIVTLDVGGKELKKSANFVDQIVSSESQASKPATPAIPPAGTLPESKPGTQEITGVRENIPEEEFQISEKESLPKPEKDFYWAIELNDGRIVYGAKDSFSNHADLAVKANLDFDQIKSAGLVNKEGYNTQGRPRDREERLDLIKQKMEAMKPKEEAEFEEWSRGMDEILADVKTVVSLGERGEFSWRKIGERNKIPVDKDGNELVDMDNTPMELNPDGTLTLYHRTSPEKAEQIKKTGAFKSLENTNETFFSNKIEGQAEGYGDAIITVKVRPSDVRINDAFHNGEVHVAVSNKKLSKNNLISEKGKGILGERGAISNQPLTEETIQAKKEALNRLKKDAGKLGATIGEYLSRRGIDQETIQKVLAEIPPEDREKKFGPYKERLVTITEQTRATMEELLKMADEDQQITGKPIEVGFLFDKMQTADDVKAVMSRMSTMFKEKIDKARRGTRTHEQTMEEARKLGLTMEEFLAREEGEAWNAAQIQAARSLTVAAGMEWKNLARRYQETGTGEQALLRQTAILMEAIPQKYGVTAEAGRALNIFKADATGEVQFLNEVEGALERIGTGMTVDQLAAVIGTLQTPSQFAKVAQEMAKPNMKDKLMWVLYNAMLSSPRTHVANISGNLGMLGLTIEERGLAGNAPWRSADGVVPGEAAAMLGAITANYQKALRIAAKVFRATSLEEAEKIAGPIKLEMRKVPITSEAFGFDPHTTHGKALDFLINISPTKGLLAEDAFFKTLAYDAEISALALREATHMKYRGEKLASEVQRLMDNPTDAMIEKARDFSNYVSFTRELGTFGQSVAKLSNSSIFAKMILPFVSTPGNIAKVSLERFPGLNLIMKEYREELKAGGATRDLALAKMANGIMLMMVSIGLAQAGMTTGYGDKKTRKMAMEGGWQPYSVTGGENFYSYDRFDPFGMWLGAGADIVQMMNTARNLEEDSGLYEQAQQLFAASAVALTRTFTSKTWLQSADDFFNVMDQIKTDPLKAGEKFAGKRAAMFIPAAARDIKNYMDPVVREVNTLSDEMISRIPGASDLKVGGEYLLPPRRTILKGEPIPVKEMLGPDFLSPLALTKDKNDPVVKEIVDNKIYLPEVHDWISGQKPSESVLTQESTRWGVKLTPQQKDRLAVIATQEAKIGEQNLYQFLKSEIQKEGYKNAQPGPDGMKAKRIQMIYHDFMEKAKIMLQDEIPELKRKVRERQEKRARAMMPAFQ